METLKGIQNRIKSIGSTKQITNSMQLVSSSKVQSAKEYVKTTKAFVKGFEDLMNSIVDSNSEFNNPFFIEQEEEKVGLLVISSDRGLCGGYNVSVAKKAIEVAENFDDITVIGIGSRINDAFKRVDLPVHINYLGISEEPLFDEAHVIAQRIYNMYLDNEINQLHLIYTKFESMLKQYPVSEKIFPIIIEDSDTIKPELFCEPDIDKALNGIIPYYLASIIYGAMAESALSEQSARMMSMDSASKNSDDIIAELTLEYNQLRQTDITEEIIEIVNGAQAIT